MTTSERATALPAKEQRSPITNPYRIKWSSHMSNLAVWENEGVLVVDSRLVAKELGVNHSDWFKNVVIKYQKEIEEDFGAFRWEEEKPSKGSQGSSPERYAFLTEEQVTVLLTYSHNTEKVRSCKRKLVKAFAKAKKLLEGIISTQVEEELKIGSCPWVKERLENISLGMDLLEDLGGWDEKTGRLLKEQVRNILLADRGQPAQKGISSYQSRLEYSILDRAISLGYFPGSSEREEIRKKAKKLYLERYGAEPIKRKQFINGDTQLVNHYGLNDLDILDEAIAQVMDKK